MSTCPQQKAKLRVRRCLRAPGGKRRRVGLRVSLKHPSAYKVSAVACAASNTNLPRLHYESLRGGSLGRIAYGLQEHLLRAQVYCRSPALVCNAGHHCIASASHGQSQ